MNTTAHLTRKAILLAAATPFALALASAPAFAQDVPTAAQNAETNVNREATQVQTPTGDQGDTAAGQEVVVTGSLFRQTDAATPSPVTTITTENLDQRGINTVQNAVQQLAANNGPALTNSFTANGAFAGAAGAGLLGFNVIWGLAVFAVGGALGMRACPPATSTTSRASKVPARTVHERSAAAVR